LKCEKLNIGIYLIYNKYQHGKVASDAQANIGARVRAMHKHDIGARVRAMHKS
jgi:hypothetical protein